MNGTKIEANANRYTFVWSKAVAKQLEKLETQIANEVSAVAVRYRLPEYISLEDCLLWLTNLAVQIKLTYVSGKDSTRHSYRRILNC